MWLESAWTWAQDNIGWLLPSGAVAAWAGKTFGALLLEVLREKRSARADQRKAATEFAHVADEYNWLVDRLQSSPLPKRG